MIMIPHSKEVDTFIRLCLFHFIRLHMFQERNVHFCSPFRFFLFLDFILSLGRSSFALLPLPLLFYFILLQKGIVVRELSVCEGEVNGRVRASKRVSELARERP
jgi:hypothetical protein